MPHLEVNDSIVTRNLTVEELLSVDQGPVQLDEIAAPGTPATGKVRLYAKSDGRLYLKDDAGTEVQLDPAGLAVLKSLFDASTVLVANTNDTPVALALAAGQMIGRLRSGGNIIALDDEDVLDILSGVNVYSLIADQWYDGLPSIGNAVIGSGTFTLTADRLYGFPFWSPRKTTWAKIGINQTLLEVGRTFKFGIFGTDSNGSPGGATRLYGSAAGIDLGSAISQEETINLELEAGWYVLSMRSDSLGVATFTRRDAGSRMLGANSTSANAAFYWFSDSGTYAGDGIPSTFPSSPSRSTSQPPRIMLRAGATP